MLPDSPAELAPAVAALALALGWAALLRRRPAWAGLALPLGALLGFALLLGIGLASPRQLFERLPGLAVVASLLAGASAPWRAMIPRLALGLVAVLATAWWMAGGPLVLVDLARAAPAMLGVSLTAGVLLLESGPRWRALALAAAGAAALLLAAAPGPWVLLALCLLGATLGAQVAGPALVFAARLPLAMLLAALAAGPALARSAPADWAAAMTPVALALFAPRFGGRWPVLTWLGLAALLLGLVAVLAAAPT